MGVLGIFCESAGVSTNLVLLGSPPSPVLLPAIVCRTLPPCCH